jgi:hypothetical protein
MATATVDPQWRGAFGASSRKAATASFGLYGVDVAAEEEREHAGR